MRRFTNLVFLAAILAINFTLARPSPVDFLFLTALVLTVFSSQVVTRNVVLLFFLLSGWLLSLWMSSLPLLDDPDALLQTQKITYALSIAICASLVAANWGEPELKTFVKVVVAATCVAAPLGIVGFVLDIDDLTWDGRAKAFLDDPNMYSAFLLPGVICSMYLLSQGGRRAVYLPALGMILLGLVVGFSRAALMSMLVWGGLYYLILNRRNLPKAVFYALAAVALLVIAVAIGSVFIDTLAEKIADRSTIAKDYDLGHGGRYDRYELAIPFILDNPLGVGALQIGRFFDEPIHNLWISSFLNYGWLAGFAFTLLIVGTVTISIRNYRQTANPLALCIFFCWLTIISCSLLHETERWRHLWLFTGMAWGLNARRIRHLGAVDPERDAEPAAVYSGGGLVAEAA